MYNNIQNLYQSYFTHTHIDYNKYHTLNIILNVDGPVVFVSSFTHTKWLHILHKYMHVSVYVFMFIQYL